MDTNNALKATEIDNKTYSRIVGQTFVFQMASFLELNKDKVDGLRYLSINKGGSARFAACFGIKDGIAKCPYSAPFGLPISVKKELSIKYFDEALEAIEMFAKENGWRQIRFILPPLFYAKEELTAWINALYRLGYRTAAVDVNYAFDMNRVYVDDYQKIIHHNARKNLKIALNSELELIKCDTEASVSEAYQVIAENRASKGYPLRMTEEQVVKTIAILEHDVFLTKYDGISVAAALVYYVTPEIAQVIYWGDRPGYGELKPINFLAYQLIRFYGDKQVRYLDIGPSTEGSLPNYGLCDFKESIGCERDLKFTFLKEL